MTFCSKCGNKLPASAEFCPKCGIKASISSAEKKEISVTNIIEQSFKPSVNAGNFLLVFMPLLLLCFTFLYLSPQLLLLITEKLPEFSTGTADIAGFVVTLLGMVSMVGSSILVYLLFSVYQRGVVIHNIGSKMRGEPKPYRESLSRGFSRYPSLFIAVLLLTILSVLLGSVRYIGPFIVLIVLCIFWVTSQGIVLDKLGFVEGFKRSYEYLRNCTSPYVIVYIITLILSTIISVIGLIPIGLAVMALIPKIISISIGVTDPSEILRALARVLVSPTLYAATIITCIIWTLNTLYTELGIPTKLYLEIGENHNRTTEN